MGNNPSAWGLSSLSGICLMFKNCLNLMETIISDQADGLPGCHSKIQRPPHPTKKSNMICQILQEGGQKAFVFKLNTPHALR